MSGIGRPQKWLWYGIAVYVLLNGLIVVVNPYASPWHYQDHDPEPIQVVELSDEGLSDAELVAVLDEIDVAYGARQPAERERVRRAGLRALSIAMFPGTVGVMVKEFIGYMGPPNDRQEAFTISVKERYNHLSRLAVARGYVADRFLYEIEPSLSKRHGPAFSEVALETAGEQPGATAVASSTLLSTAGDAAVVAGEYIHAPATNDWHYVTISRVDADTLQWTNRAGVSWLLAATADPALFATGSDYPYVDSPYEFMRVAFADGSARSGVLYVTGPFGERYDRTP